MTPEQIAHYRGLLASSISTRAQLAEQRGDWHQYRFLCGFNAGIEQARMLYDRACHYDPSVPVEHHTVTYPAAFGPHAVEFMNDDGEMIRATKEDVSPWWIP